jgi:predicted AlkP superfamily phosphohydrolase/phosphomutase
MKTVLLGLDGGTFSILRPLMETGVMPFLRELAAEGTQASLRSTPNPLTPPAWASVMTGRSPGNHGVFDFVRAEETASGPAVTLVDSRDLACETIWTMATRAGRSVTALNFPLMFPPANLADALVIPGFVSWRLLRRATNPPGLYDRLKSLPGFDPKQVAWDIDLEQKCIQAMAPDDYVSWLQFHIGREHQWLQIVRTVMTESPCDFTAYLADGPDKIQHLAWRFLDPICFPDQPSAWEREIRELCLEYFRQLDASIADIVTLAGSDARIFLVSDHGFGASREIFYLNAWLHQRGLLAWKDPEAALDTTGEIFTQRMKTQVVDWSQTVAYALTPSSNGVVIRQADAKGRPGIDPDSYETFRRALAEDLLAATDPRSGQPIVTRVLTREEAFPGRHMHRAPDLTLVLRDQGFISILNSASPLRDRPEPRGMHQSDGIFLAAGAGIRRGQVLGELSILDVCPTLLYSLAMVIPENLEGRFPEEIFEASALEARPPRFGKGNDSHTAYTAIPAVNLPDASTVEQEQAVLTRLRALGYLE